MTENKQMAYVERGAVDAVLLIVQVLCEAGDETGALRELAHFVEKMRECVMVALEEVVENERGFSGGFPWVVKSRPERFRLES
jgi:hypothetical protein